MIDIIQKHLDAVERIQAELEDKIRQALGDVTPAEILERADELPAEIAAELQDWIERHVLQDLVDESQRFLSDVEDDAEEQVAANEDQVRGLVAVLFDGYIASVTAIITGALSEIKNSANLQQSLGRASDLIIAEMQSENAGIGARLKAMTRRLVVETDSFVSSAGGVVPIAVSKEPLIWITVQDKKVCDDCFPRHGETRTAAEWIDLGLPRTGWSVCTGYCRCILVPLSAASKFGMPGPIVRPRRKS